VISALLLAVSLQGSACATQESPDAPCPEARAPTDWRMLATEDDRRRVREWRDAWTEALDQARAAGHETDIGREGPLLDPDAALGDPLPPPGDYNCRTIKLGSPPPGLLYYVAYPAFHCRVAVAGQRIDFTKITGSQRPLGRLFADNDRRLIFLGTMQLGDERRAFQYGTDQDRDLAGLVERVGDNRWRLVFPYPHFESLLDVVELTPRAAAR
jgi:hypothetical protein